MAIDFEAIRKKLGQLSGQSTKRNVMWRPPEGEETTIRIVPFKDNDGNPFKERWFYYNIGNNPGLLAPYQFNEPDPIQELIQKLRDDRSKESYELAKKLYPKMRAYAAVIVRGEEEKGVRLWSFGKQVYQSLLNFMLDEDYGDITDISEGHDIRVTCTKAPGRKWATTEVRPRPKSSALSKDKKQAAGWVEDIPDLGDMYQCKTYDELENIINAWLEGDDEPGQDSFQPRNETSTSSNTSTNETSSSSDPMSKIDEAFADLDF